MLIDIFPEHRDKFTIIQNEISLQLIKEMADEEIELVKENDELVIVIVGRTVEQKGYHVAIVISVGKVEVEKLIREEFSEVPPWITLLEARNDIYEKLKEV